MAIIFKKNNNKIFLSAFLIALLFIFWLNHKTFFLRNIFAGTLGVVSNFGRLIAKAPNFFVNKQFLEQENNTLREKNEILTIDYVEFENLKKENQELKDILNYVDTYQTEGILANILSRTSDPFISEILINKGSQDGIEAGDPVLARNGILIGRISSVSSTSSTVLLISDPRSKIPAKILDVSDSLGLLEGQNVLYRLKMLPHDLDIPLNSIVVTEVYESKIPSGLILGTVKSVEINPDDPFKTAVVLPPISINDISFVLVQKNIDSRVYEP